MRLGVPVMASLILVAAGLVAAPGGAQELPCAGHNDGVLTADGTQGCAKERFDRMRAGGDDVAVEQLDAATPDADGLRAEFVRADEDGDGRISREEWMRSFGPARAGDAPGADGRAIGTE